ECAILSHSATPFCYWFAAIIIYQGGGVALSYIHPDLTAVELSNRTHFIILIVIVLLIFRPQEITIKIKSKIKRANVAKHLLNSMAVHPGPLPRGEAEPGRDVGRILSRDGARRRSDTRAQSQPRIERVRFY